MTRTFNIKGALAALLLTCCCLQSAFSQSFWTETFTGKAPTLANWIHSGTNPGPRVWQWTDDLNAGDYGPGDFAAATAATGYMYFDSDSNGNFTHDVRLTGVGVPASCTGKSNVHLKLFTYYRTFSGGDVARIGISTDGTNFTYHNVPQFDALVQETAGNPQVFQGNIDIAIPEADGQAQVWVQFRWEGTFEYYWKVDDLELYEEAGAIPCDQNPLAVICDNFETYTIGNVSPQATWWTPWNLTDASPVGAEVSADFASQGTKAMKVKPDGAPNGDDQLLLLGNKSTGRYSLKWKQYVQTGKNAYFNVQNSETPGQQYNGEYYFDLDGTGRVVEVVNGVATVLETFTYPHDKWFNVEFIIDLDNNLAKIFFDNKLVRVYAYTGNIGGIDYYAADANTTYYVDEVEYVGLTPIVYNADECGGAVDISTLLGQTPDVPQTTGIYNNTTATVDATDPLDPSCWLDGVPNTDPTINGSMWFTFTGDGGTYHIETVPCNSTDYIDDGDTQLALYTGECGNLIPVAGGCNEDLAGAADFRAGLDFETEDGVNYYMLIDGWSDPATAFVALGEYCIQFTQKPSITCAEGEVGTYTVGNNGFVCNATTTGGLFAINNASFAIPTIGPVYGMAWAITTEAVTGGAWPPSLTSYWGSFAVNPSIYAPNLTNNGTPLTQNAIWYFTPVVVAGAVDTVPANAPFLHQLDLTGACYFVGESTPLIMLAELAPLDAVADVTNATPGLSDGLIDLTVTGGIFDLLQDPLLSYTVEWTGPNGFTSSDEDISGLEAGDYVAIITDITGCVDPYDFPVSVTTGVKDPASVKSLSINPNPTSNLTTLNLVLEQTADVRIEVLNTLGQSLQTVDAGKVNTLNQQLNLSRFTDGTYFLRVTVNGETAIRRVVLNR
ncbi:MAG TPA: T9SS type A sorting domain-containing protein [Saprospiraceae bacterium]|nr:T9SS type A sorting domain-containing protein [Saprospiraceae bacterium]